MNALAQEEFVRISPEVLYFGTPVAVISSLNIDGSTNLAAMSSFWALADRFVIGIGGSGQTGANLVRSGECVLNFPSPREWQHVERLGHTTGRSELSDYHRQAGIVHAKDKFAISGFTPLASEMVAPLRAAECPFQIEARVVAHHGAQGEADFHIFELRKLIVHAHPDVLQTGRGRIDLDAWSPLFYLFRHYFGKGGWLGRSFRARA